MPEEEVKETEQTKEQEYVAVLTGKSEDGKDIYTIWPKP